MALTKAYLVIGVNCSKHGNSLGTYEEGEWCEFTIYATKGEETAVEIYVIFWISYCIYFIKLTPSTLNLVRKIACDESVT